MLAGKLAAAEAAAGEAASLLQARDSTMPRERQRMARSRPATPPQANGLATAEAEQRPLAALVTEAEAAGRRWKAASPRPGSV